MLEEVLAEKRMVCPRDIGEGGMMLKIGRGGGGEGRR